MDATRAAVFPRCPQIQNGIIHTNEDCLRLNVYSPINVTRAPVIVFFHGGGYLTGSADQTPEFKGNHLINLGEDVVIVEPQYRLNVFGFLGGDALRNRSASGSAGNYGLQDQRLALQWVKENIHVFGGDADRVMLSGQSAGAGAVSCHMLTPKSCGLFHTASMAR